MNDVRALRADIEKATNGEGDRIGTRGPRNLLELLADEFTIEDAKRVRQQQGLDVKRTTQMISTWKARGYVCQMSVSRRATSSRTRRDEQDKRGLHPQGERLSFFIIIKPRTSGFEIVGNELD